VINTLVTCRGRCARFNNNRDIAMIRTGKTRSADVDILKGSRNESSSGVSVRFRPHTLLTLRQFLKTRLVVTAQRIANLLSLVLIAHIIVRWP
jgi:hypothetical protein